MVSETVGFSEGRPAPPVNEDHIHLDNFCHKLSATSGTLSNVDQTRREAQLLMMLSFIPNDEIIEPLPACASDSSFSSGSSRESRNFGFSCPSLSLEHPAFSHDFGESPTRAAPTSNLYPATLLERVLKVDDRDASRLSADAMARNVLQSFQKAMDWRIAAWMKALSTALLESEHQPTAFGGSLDVETLLETPHGALLLALRNLQEENTIKVLQTSTSFETLPNSTNSGTTDYEDEYEVVKPLKLCCEIYLDTPLGYSKIDIDAPGNVMGSFSEGELSSVQIDVDTEILAVMMEKSCRKVVRACAEKAVKELEYVKCPVDTQDTVAQEDLCEKEATTTADAPFAVSTPNPQSHHDTSGAVVTPHTNSTFAPEETNSKILLPESLGERVSLRRRISPQRLTARDLMSPPPSTAMGFADEGPAHKRARRAPLVSPMASEGVYHDIPNGPALPTLVEVACRARTAGC